MVEFLTIEHFKPLVGRIFHFQGTPFSMPLDRIESNGRPLIPGAKRIAFSLIFVGPRDHVLLGGLYECQVDNGPVWPIYVSPIQTWGERQEYQAMFD